MLKIHIYHYLNISAQLVHNLFFLLFTHVNLLHAIPEVIVFVSGQLLHLEDRERGYADQGFDIINLIPGCEIGKKKKRKERANKSIKLMAKQNCEITSVYDKQCWRIVYYESNPLL